VALVPGGTRNVLREGVLRRWPVASYRALAERLVRDGVDVVLVGDGHDQWVTPEFAGVRVRNEIGRHSITGTLGVLRACRLVVSHDTGPLHLARLVRTPAVALFGPTSPRSMVGDAPDVTWLWGGAHLACRPCYDGREFARCENNLCMQSISVDEVHAAVQRRLASVVAEAEAVAPAVRGPSGAAGVTR
jgi:heptosyltransferase-2